LVPIFFGEKMNEVVVYLPYFLLGVCSYTVANSILEYHQSRRKYLITIISFFVSLIQIPILLEMTSTLQGFVFVMSTFGIMQLFIIAVAHRLSRYSTALSQNSYAFFGLFKKQKTTPLFFLF
jgi:O-antigen/teichoic acid export membrane protein